MRLHIIGMPSAGKTTLTVGVPARLGVPHHDLDTLAFIDDRWTLRPASERDAMLAGILEEASFITEGAFLGWTEDLFAARVRPLEQAAQALREVVAGADGVIVCQSEPSLAA